MSTKSATPRYEKKQYQIMAFLQTGRSQTEIAGVLNRFKSTISREICRNSFEWEYNPSHALVTVTARRRFTEKAAKPRLEELQTARTWFRPDGYVNQ
ncbi:helix-turn-helix domain-containing protein [Desulforhopalus vacuolatus]|uniref:helix-turn-helix domain-containing protein n=1 Tax=Desulforhopalus vacuolatus TaxID=40414 RepID=UPI001964B7DC|nr:helix-turn-helix domain-containing protein [Desulforhopalus vacuolatus]MBM9520367.1 helix-turn-helix domain-containing protein [Desulforhopalus vacuolatus]